MIAQDAWLIYGDSGLLEVHEPGFQDFTVTDGQYGNPKYDQQGVLIQFEITPLSELVSSSYVINENGIFVGKKGLNIINDSGASRIVFKSNSEDAIILLSDINVYNNKAELVFIGPKIYCNGCRFGGTDRVTFSTDSGTISIASFGLSSMGISLNLVAERINATGTINVDNLSLRANEEASFAKLWSKGLETMINGDLTFKELYVVGDAFVQANKWQVLDKASIQGNSFSKAKLISLTG
jgi:hypothetical protein